MITDIQFLSDNVLVGISSATGNPVLFVKATHNIAGAPISDSDVDGVSCIKAGLGEYWILQATPGGGAFNGNRPITRVSDLLGINVGATTSLADFVNKLMFPAVVPIDSFNIDGQTNESREAGGSTAYTLNWGVTKETNPITGIVVDGNVITPTGNTQSGTINGNVGSTTPQTYTKFMAATAAPDAPVTASVTLTFAYKLFWAPVAAGSTTSAQVRALANSMLTNAGNVFTLNTGTTQVNFEADLPPGKTIVSVIDQDALNLDITAEYIGTPITYNDAGGTPHVGTRYLKTQSVPYPTNHRHLITTN